MFTQLLHKRRKVVEATVSNEEKVFWKDLRDFSVVSKNHNPIVGYHIRKRPCFTDERLLSAMSGNDTYTCNIFLEYYVCE